ncbi:glycerophosphodiester phosphodiesterase [Aliidiomarina sedimenti]|uniref:glycerophosphodiester phosphodiesterase n=1 Tax=Aliidiomarina sedimenti TaxID=1933879 RepID=A0ABY0BYQ2_9GAMM|nr:glycerophosphodiester phosphodiesterase family protein [Aliidiomarina sedimenti]RUO29749.1 glycerophosphodiester phosphodiesterase [Aliidiomarina sedimenti]
MLTTHPLRLLLLICLSLPAMAVSESDSINIQVGERPLYLTDRLPEGPLKSKLQSCDLNTIAPQPFSIAHRGASLFYPEHSEAAYLAAIRQGAGVVECDVTFTRDKKLVCRHSQCDLHHTTDILARPELASRCRVPFTPFDPQTGEPAQAQCCTSEFTLAEIESLCAVMEGFDETASTAQDYLRGGPAWRTQLHGQCEKPMSHAASIALIDEYGRAMTPELKAAEVAMPFNDFSRADFADAVVEAYIDADIEPQRVFLQSFHLEDIEHWLANWPQFAEQAIWLDGRQTLPDFDPQQPQSWQISMQELYDKGVRYLGPPLWMLVTSENGNIVPSLYAQHAKAAGLKLIAWTVERSGTLYDGGGWYYQTISEITEDPSMVLQLLDVLKHDVGVEGVFSDWPATTTYFAHCTAE